MLLGGLSVKAEEPTGISLKILPWNGSKAAISLTFDDGDISHIDTVIPALDARGFKGTFYLVAGSNNSKTAWSAAAKEGHEIGNHSMQHLQPNNFTPEEVERETLAAQKKLVSLTNSQVYTFAYPFTTITPDLREKLQNTHLAARGGWGNYYMKPNVKQDWLNIPSQGTNTKTSLDVYKGWVDKAVKQGAWTVFMIHGIEGTITGYEPVPKAIFYGLLDYLQNPDIWVAPLGIVSAYWRALKAIEATRPVVTADGVEYKWEVLPFYPKNITLLINVSNASGNVEVFQSSQKLMPDVNGRYRILFNTGSLQIRTAR
jgi:peptidoglycan/xylan/chitin deacetylase (PgdA/CDA1 family)